MIKIAITGIVAALLAALFKNKNQEYATYIALSAALIIVGIIVTKLSTVIGVVRQLGSYIMLDNEYLTVLFKLAGISYVGEFAASICLECGHKTLANQIEIASKVIILTMTLPVLLTLITTIERFLKF